MKLDSAKMVKLKNLKKVILFLFICFSQISCDAFFLETEDSIVFYGSSNIIMDGDNGKVRGVGRFGQYYLMPAGGSGGCCPSSASLDYKGKPKGEIAVYWWVFNNNTKKIDSFYYAYDPNPVIEIPPKGPGHRVYIVYNSFGQLGLDEEALTQVQLMSAPFHITRGITTGFQVGKDNTFYYKVYSRDKDFRFSTIRTTPSAKFSSIEGIEITEKQYVYITDHNYLDENAPDLTAKQLEYIREKQAKKKRNTGFFSF